MLDLSKVTCDQRVKYQLANPKFIAMWLSGYFHGKRGDTMIDTQKLIADADAVENYCFKNPQAPLKTKARPKLKNFMRIPLTAREAQMSMKGVRISVRGFGVTFATGFASVFTLGFVPTSALADSFCVVTHPHNISARAGIKKASFIGVSPDRET